MLFDTDILSWIQRGNTKAARLVEQAPERCISAQTYMELLQCAQSKSQHRVIKDFLGDFNFTVLPLTENIGHRAMIYVEEFTLSSGLRAADALVAATAIENNLKFCTGNAKHFKSLKELQMQVFKP